MLINLLLVILITSCVCLFYLYTTVKGRHDQLVLKLSEAKEYEKNVLTLIGRRDFQAAEADEEIPKRLDVAPGVAILADTIIEEYINFWYTPLTTDSELTDLIRMVLCDVVDNLLERIQKLNLSQFLVHSIIPVLLLHLKNFRTARSNLMSRYPSFPFWQPQIQEQHVVEELRTAGRIHVCCLMDETVYLRDVAKHLLRDILPSEHSKSRVVRIVLRELVGGCVFQPALALVTPHLLNSLIVETLGGERYRATSSDVGEVGGLGMSSSESGTRGAVPPLLRSTGTKPPESTGAPAGTSHPYHEPPASPHQASGSGISSVTTIPENSSVVSQAAVLHSPFASPSLPDERQFLNKVSSPGRSHSAVDLIGTGIGPDIHFGDSNPPRKVSRTVKYPRPRLLRKGQSLPSIDINESSVSMDASHVFSSMEGLGSCPQLSHSNRSAFGPVEKEIDSGLDLLRKREEVAIFNILSATSHRDVRGSGLFSQHASLSQVTRKRAKDAPSRVHPMFPFEGMYVRVVRAEVVRGVVVAPTPGKPPRTRTGASSIAVGAEEDLSSDAEAPRRRSKNRRNFEETTIPKKQSRLDNIVDSPFILYELVVATPTSMWAVFRRFKQFEELHRRLKKQFGNSYSISLPPKRAFGNLEPDFVEGRRVALDVYMQRLLQSHRFCNADTVRRFVSNEWVPLREGSSPGSLRSHVPGSPSQTFASLPSAFSGAFTASRRSWMRMKNELGLGKTAVTTPTLSPRMEAVESGASSAVSRSPRSSVSSLSSDGKPVPSTLEGSTLDTGTLLGEDGSLAPGESLGGEDTGRPSSASSDEVPSGAAPEDGALRGRASGSRRAPSDSDEGEDDGELVQLSFLDCDGVQSGELVNSMFSLMDEVLELQERGWLRRQAYAMSKKTCELMLGLRCNLWLDETLRSLTTTEYLSSALTWICQTLWPHNHVVQSTRLDPSVSADHRADAHANAGSAGTGSAGYDSRHLGHAQGTSSCGNVAPTATNYTTSQADYTFPGGEHSVVESHGVRDAPLTPPAPSYPPASPKREPSAADARFQGGAAAGTAAAEGSWTNPTEAERLHASRAALHCLSSALPAALETMVGPRCCVDGIRKVHDLLQYPLLDKHLAYVLFDELLAALYPDLRVPLSLHRRSLARDLRAHRRRAASQAASPNQPQH